jgi:hypothetical protein
MAQMTIVKASQVLPLSFLQSLPMTKSGISSERAVEFAGAGEAMDDFVGPERRTMAEGSVDRRAHTRYEVDAWAEVIVHDASMLFRGRVLDLSVGGCYVETEARLRLAPGTRVEIVFRVRERVFRCEATSRMLRTRGAGFLFEAMNAATRAELEALIATLERGDVAELPA